MFLDSVKDFVGKIKVLDLGVSRSIYENPSNYKLLETKDLILPSREKKDSHKGSFGHLAITSGDKQGASELSALSASKFGCGLVTLITHKEHFSSQATLMYSQTLPSNVTALACGMGLGSAFSKLQLEEFFNNQLPVVLDADIFYNPLLLTLLKHDKIVITPHPKEFVSLLNMTEMANISVDTLQENRFTYVELFCKKYPNVILLLKGANVIIGKDEKFFINTHGSSRLAKGGSGDVLSGLIASLLAQGYETLQATISASLAHTQVAKNYTGADFSLTADDLIAGIGNL